jgi:hypothetical protein
MSPTESDFVVAMLEMNKLLHLIEIEMLRVQLSVEQVLITAFNQ